MPNDTSVSQGTIHRRSLLRFDRTDFAAVGIAAAVTLLTDLPWWRALAGTALMVVSVRLMAEGVIDVERP